MDYKEITQKRIELRERATQYVYYAIIMVASIIALVFLPLLSSTVEVEWNLPTSEVGWIIYIFTRLSVAFINVLIFYSFMQQARINVKTDEKYIEANEILSKVKSRVYVPRSPKKFNAKEYSSKGITIFISTALASVALTQALLSYDYVTMLTYLVTIIFGIIFGVLQMLKAEEYWTIEYYDYAKMIEQKIKGEEELCTNSVIKNSEI